MHPEVVYRESEDKAGQYLAELIRQVETGKYAAALMADFKLWQRAHVRRPFAAFASARRPKGVQDVQGADSDKGESANYRHYLRWLKLTGRLERYLERSVSYIYMRDLGQDLSAAGTKARIRQVTASLQERLRVLNAAGQQAEALPLLNYATLYRWGQKEGVEQAVIWLIDKLKHAVALIPEGMNAEHAQRKLMKIVLGVVLHAREELNASVAATGQPVPAAQRAERLDAAIRLGYAYGLTYPFIDDLLDAQVLTDEETREYAQLIRAALVTGQVQKLDSWKGPHETLVRAVYEELSEAFELIAAHQPLQQQRYFFAQAYVFFHAQELDRAKSLEQESYTNEELYLPIILKSASSRLLARSVLAAPVDEGFEQRTFFYGIYNQLADDLADVFDDLQAGAVTPYTYYLTHRKQRPDLINPFALYWAVIAHLLHDVYREDAASREVILNRAINGLKRWRDKRGSAPYKELLDELKLGHPAFEQLLEQLVQKAEDVDFLDKLVRDELVISLKREREEKAEFLETLRTVREQINEELRLEQRLERQLEQRLVPSKERRQSPADGLLHSSEEKRLHRSAEGLSVEKVSLIDAANYALESGGKRLRPILAWLMGVRRYQLAPSVLMPLLRSLEYMHTASLVFDDLPTQDDAATRRGRPTLHRIHDGATAELTGLLLMQRATQEQAELSLAMGLEPSRVLAMMHYSASKAEELCMGQQMDLQAKGRLLTLEQLNTICFYKTGIAFEAALVMPAILAAAAATELEQLKAYAYHAGIAFQIKDDLLDLQGDAALLGKPVGQDETNRTSSFVAVLGEAGAKQEMWVHYCRAIEVLEQMERPPGFLKHLLDYIVNRDK